MSPFRLFRMARAVGVAILPAVVLLCCADRAAAGCGTYVTILGPDGQILNPAGHDSMPGQKPCQGPNCTGGDRAPAPIPPAPTSPTTEAKCLPADNAVGTGGGFAERVPPTPDGMPIRKSRSIFHPPRAS